MPMHRQPLLCPQVPNHNIYLFLSLRVLEDRLLLPLSYPLPLAEYRNRRLLALLRFLPVLMCLQ